jgi:hypothetical protein
MKKLSLVAAVLMALGTLISMPAMAGDAEYKAAVEKCKKEADAEKQKACMAEAEKMK